MADTQTDTSSDSTTQTSQTDTQQQDGKDQLGDAGKKALDDERAARKAADKALKEAQAELDKLKQLSMSDQEKAVATARAEARKEALETANTRVLRAEIRAAASGKLADPGDAVALLGDLSKLLDSDGEPDGKAIKAAIDALVKDKPYLSPRPGNGSGEGGPRGGNGAGEFSMDDWLRAKAKK